MVRQPHLHQRHPEGGLIAKCRCVAKNALEQRAPHLYGQPFDRPQSRSNSSSLSQEAIQAAVARQLVGFDQRGQVQELDIQRLRKQLEEATHREQAVRDQVLREVAMTSSAQTSQQNPVAIQIAPAQEAQVPAFIPNQGCAQSAAATGRGLLSSLWSGI